MQPSSLPASLGDAAIVSAGSARADHVHVGGDILWGSDAAELASLFAEASDIAIGAVDAEASASMVLADLDKTGANDNLIYTEVAIPVAVFDASAPFPWGTVGPASVEFEQTGLYLVYGSITAVSDYKAGSGGHPFKATATVSGIVSASVTAEDKAVSGSVSKSVDFGDDSAPILVRKGDSLSFEAVATGSYYKGYYAAGEATAKITVHAQRIV